MDKDEKVYCKNCQHMIDGGYFTLCGLSKKEQSTYFDRYTVYSGCHEINNGNSCPDFEWYSPFWIFKRNKKNKGVV